jgi:hypothetical protein
MFKICMLKNSPESDPEKTKNCIHNIGFWEYEGLTRKSTLLWWCARVTMTTWSSDDTRVVTAVSDASLCVWDSATCQLITRLKGHQVVTSLHPANVTIRRPVLLFFLREENNTCLGLINLPALWNLKDAVQKNPVDFYNRIV